MSWELKALTEGLQSVGDVTTRNGVRVGIVKGYLASFEPDVEAGRYGKPDRFHPGAFKNSIAEYKKRDGGRQINLRDHHGRTIGGFPIDSVHEDSFGLWGEGEINLEVKQGEEAYALARQGVLTDFSIGFRAVNDSVGFKFRDIYEARIGEASIIDEPKNRGAKIMEVKGLGSEQFRDLELAPADYKFDEEKARERVDEMPYRVGNGSHAFLDEAQKFMIGDVVDGKLVAVPAAIRGAAQELKGSEGDGEHQHLIHHVERYLAKMNEDSPFDERQFFSLDEVKGWEPKDFERALRATGRFSKSAARYLLYRVANPDEQKSHCDEKKECSGSQSCPDCGIEFKCSSKNSKKGSNEGLEGTILSGLNELKQELRA